MADTAYRVTEHGDLERVEAKDLGPRDRDGKFVCCGRGWDGQPCLVPMSLAIGSERANYFTAGEGKHRTGCPYDESEPIFKRVSTFDKTGDTFDLEGFFDRLMSGQQGEKRQISARESAGRTADKLESSQNDRQLNPRTEFKNPGSARDLTFLLLSKDPDDFYGNHPVRNILIDDRSIRDLNLADWEDGRSAIILAMRTRQYGNIPVSKGDIVLKAWTGRGSGPSLFLKFTASRETRDKIFTADQEKVVFALLSRWRRMPGQEAVLLGGFLQDRCFVSIQKRILTQK